ncbi:NAD(P)H-dependent flavin oxidoreductase [Planctomycetes bacterium TBK1r]|uniref:Nitronate monooxygenase n=1 Tax=Stieleria magnilauensis TaxID=2527963 RepID=A0ABX5XQA5_9BACT|nr:Nitronate monooxygenase [Planctomycetes bacterium TBK1r]
MGSTGSLQTPLCDVLECRYPILQAGMGGVARAELVAAVSNAGAFGCLGMVRESPQRITQQINEVRSLTDKPFGVNLIPAATDPELFRVELDACLRAGVHTMVYFWDVVPDAINRAKQAGCRVVYQVGDVDQAIKAEAAGADVIVAQGVEAGGHVHGTVTSLVLLPQIVDAASIPVVGSGGFGSGRSLVAALAMGAQGIHCGTVLLATHESFAHDVHKRQIVRADADDTLHTDAYAINWPPHSAVRVIKSQSTEPYEQQPFGHHADEMPREQVAEEEGRPVYLMSTDSPLKSMTGELEKLAMFGGQVAGQVTAIDSAATVIRRIVDEAEAVIEGFARSAGPAGDSDSIT